MKTLIFNGSPRPHGDTAWAIARLRETIPGEIITVDAYRCRISPCVDCRYCKSHPGCAIQDEKQAVYDQIRDCDNIIIASPVYFAELTGKLLDVASRLQTFFCASRFRGEVPVETPKKGGVILMGGGSGGMDKAFSTARMLLHAMNCRDIHPLIASRNTDSVPACEDETLMPELQALSLFLTADKSVGGQLAAAHR